MTVLSGDLLKFSKLITDNISIGIKQDKPTMYLDYNGEYFCDNERKKFKGHLYEYVEEVIVTELDTVVTVGKNEQHSYIEWVEKCFLITREIGKSDTDREEDCRISLVYEKDNEIHTWSPTYQELFDAFKIIIGDNGKHHIKNLLNLNDELAKSVDFKGVKLHLENLDDFSVKAKGYDDYLPIDVLYILFKHIQISELRYSGRRSYGRYMPLIALLEYISEGKDFKDIESKYKFKKKSKLNNPS
ncbi:hypothetical protein CIB95_01945 [Lottiidibacillus patelloidae]|uniref:Uncharacterized protein n=1 Tax=Lottiidibacillus patelloidae TaxID=2670334 RepID=A0A263BYW3_9BACI|nr:hypothetical protein [Lottiidibacillus patelloidae]OZM58356.1 hypothetical protein CIB95_01945 [Lottiidibacillus patelloidae]